MAFLRVCCNVFSALWELVAGLLASVLLCFVKLLTSFVFVRTFSNSFQYSARLCGLFALQQFFCLWWRWFERRTLDFAMCMIYNKHE